MEFILGGLAACGACLFTNPVDVVKTRLQLQGELRHKGEYLIHYRNVFHGFFAIAKTDGLRSLQKGLVPALFYQATMNGTRLGLFHIIEDLGWTRNNLGSVSPSSVLVIGAFSGMAGACVGSPFYLIKTHLQSQTNQVTIAVGYQHHHAGFLAAIKSIYKKSGILGLWRGYSGALPRVCVGSAAQLSTFTKSRELIENLQVFAPNSWAAVFAASMLSGAAVTVFMTPLDVVSTRLYNQGLDSKGKGLLYSGPFDCFIKILKKEGVLGFYKGVLANCLRIGPHTVLTLIMWTYLREMEDRIEQQIIDKETT